MNGAERGPSSTRVDARRRRRVNRERATLSPKKVFDPLTFCVHGN